MAGPVSTHGGQRLGQEDNESIESEDVVPAPSTSAPHAMMVAAQAGSSTSPRRQRGAGRGLSWSNEELTALVVQGYDISSDPAVGAGQTADKYADRIRSAFLEKMPPEACSATGTKCALDNRRWRGRPSAACLRKYKEVVKICTRVYELRKRVECLQLTGGPSDKDLDRVALALYNKVATIGNRELIYTIASTPGYNVGKFEHAAQYEFLARHTTLLEAGVSPTTVAGFPEGSVDTAVGPGDDGGPGFQSPAFERPLGSKAAKRNKRGRESLEGSEVATSVREFGEQLKVSDESNARRAEEKLKLSKQAHLLKMYQTLFVHESSTATREEKALAEKKLRRQFFSSLGEGMRAASEEEKDVPDCNVDEVGFTTNATPCTRSADRINNFLPLDYSDVPHVHGATEADDISQESS
jgi:hypothetical protein